VEDGYHPSRGEWLEALFPVMSLRSITGYGGGKPLA